MFHRKTPMENKTKELDTSNPFTLKLEEKKDKNEMSNNLTFIPKTKSWLLQQFSNNIMSNSKSQMKSIEKLNSFKTNNDNKTIEKKISNNQNFNQNDNILKTSKESLNFIDTDSAIQSIGQKDITEPHVIILPTNEDYTCKKDYNDNYLVPIDVTRCKNISVMKSVSDSNLNIIQHKSNNNQVSTDNTESVKGLGLNIDSGLKHNNNDQIKMGNKMILSKNTPSRQFRSHAFLDNVPSSLEIIDENKENFEISNANKIKRNTKIKDSTQNLKIDTEDSTLKESRHLSSLTDDKVLCNSKSQQIINSNEKTFRRCYSSSSMRTSHSEVGPSNFEKIKLLGRGDVGKVYLVVKYYS